MAQKDASRVALISGANKGLGLEMAEQLGKLGITVLIGARTLDKAEEAAAALKKKGVDAHPIRLDVCQQSDIQAAASDIQARFGKLDILINNAGVMLEGEWMGNRTSSTPLQRTRDTFETNFFAVVALTLEMLPLLRKSPAGRIVNMSSVMGSLALHADPGSPIYDVKPFAYNTSKAALNSFTLHLAHELKDTKIKVNSAHPGWAKTELGGPYAPMEVAEAGKTGVQLATLNEDAPSAGFFHLGDRLPF